MKVFWFDSETTGLEPKRHGIAQLAYIIEIDREEVEHGTLYSDCAGKELDPKAMEINGFTPERLSTFPPAVEMYQRLVETLGFYVDKYDREDKFTAAGFNVEFDMGFLRQLWKENQDAYFGSFFSYGVIDPSQIVRFLQYAGVDFGTSAKLVEIAKRLGVADEENAHDAMADIRMTKDVADRLLNWVRVKRKV